MIDTPNRIFSRGEFVRAAGGLTFEVRNPADDTVVAQVADAGAPEAAAAVDAADEAFAMWRERPAVERGQVLLRIAAFMRRDTERLAALMTAEQGKPLAQARGEVEYAAGFLDWAAAEGERVYGEIVPTRSPEKRALVLRQPVGPCAAITPWNFPIAMITRKVGPALACGCTMVVKPAEQTPLSALAFAGLAREAGLPPGVLEVVPTSRPEPVGRSWCEDARIRKLSFTGSTEVGRELMRSCAGTVKRISLELGGHAPVIVFEDADLERAVAGIVAAKFRNSGQTCVCINRIYAQREVADALAGLLATEIAKLRVGRGDDGVSEVGPLIDDAAVAKVERHVAQAREEGARVICGGHRASVAGSGPADRFYEPTLLTDVRDECAVMREETFGPVAPLGVFDSEDEVVARANATEYGLAAYLFTRDAGRLMRVAERLEYGIVGANDGRPSAVYAPFGGVKQSGFGREGGRWVMDEYTVLKYVSWAL